MNGYCNRKDPRQEFELQAHDYNEKQGGKDWITMMAFFSPPVHEHVHRTVVAVIEERAEARMTTI